MGVWDEDLGYGNSQIPPDVGWSPGLFVALSVAYLATALLFGLKGARTAVLVRQPDTG